MQSASMCTIFETVLHHLDRRRAIGRQERGHTTSAHDQQSAQAAIVM
jgi:hypothetical protein